MKELEKYFFDREIIPSEDFFKESWVYYEDFYEKGIENKDILLFSIHAFNNIDLLCEKYNIVNICIAIKCIAIDVHLSDFCFAFIDEKIDENLRISAIKSFEKIFSTFFNTYCYPKQYNDIEDPRKYCCNYVCFMWWDLFPTCGIPYKESMVKTDKTIIEMLQFILNLDNIACKESALHGLGHWHLGYPEKVEEIITNSMSNIPHELHEYAKKAMYGDVQ